MNKGTGNTTLGDTLRAQYEEQQDALSDACYAGLSENLRTAVQHAQTSVLWRAPRENIDSLRRWVTRHGLYMNVEPVNAAPGQSNILFRISILPL